MTTDPRVSVVMVNWNGWRDTLAAYQSLLASNYANWHLVVVDNASADDSVEQLSVHAPGITLLQSSINSGFAGGCNIALRSILDGDSDYVFLLNNDAAVEPGTLSQLLQASAKLNSRAILGSAVKYSPSGKYQFIGSRRRSDTARPHWYEPCEEHLDLLENDLVPTDMVFGAAMLVPIGTFRALGVFDERFFLNYEETDFCYRATAVGYECYIVSASTVHHKSGASLGPFHAPMQTYFMSRNELLFTEKHGSTIQQLRSIKRRVVQYGKMVLKAQPEEALIKKAMGLAIRDYILRRFGDCPPVIRDYAKRFRDQLSRQNARLIRLN